MVRITGLLAEDLRKELYQLWEVRFFSLAEHCWVYTNHYYYCDDDSPVCFLQEYENQSSHEARVVKELDQLEMILQAHEYEELEGNPGRLQEFFTSTEGFITFMHQTMALFRYFT